MPVTLELVLGNDGETYERLLAALPAGESNLQRGIIVPAHPKNRPQTFLVGGLTPDVIYFASIQGESVAAPKPLVVFVSTTSNFFLTVPLPYGVVSIDIYNNLKDSFRFSLSVTHYAVFFRAEASQISSHTFIPLRDLEANIISPYAYRLALPMLNGTTKLISSDLEIMAILAHKLIVKNLLHRPGRELATEELLAALCSSHAYLYPMKNDGALSAPLYRAEEQFSGWEAHCWIANREIERWRAFIVLLNNLPQLYNILQVEEGEVYLESGGRVQRHIFDFDSPFANSVISSSIFLDECFAKLFKLSVTVEAEHFLTICQANYPFDNFIAEPGLATPDADPLAITNWTDFSLTGRFEQQYDISYQIHNWVYDSPVIGVIDGINRFFQLSGVPANPASLKVFIDGLLIRLGEDYILSTGTDLRASLFPLNGLNVPDPQLITISLGTPLPALAPYFVGLEIEGGANAQALLTAAEHTTSCIKFVISHPPLTPVIDPEFSILHYATPAIAATPGSDQYGIESLAAASSTYALTFPTATANTDYQIFTTLGEDPLPGGGAPTATQVLHIVRGKTVTGATIEFSDPLPNANMKLHWWIFEDDAIPRERGTIVLNASDSQRVIPFINGPYNLANEPPLLLIQLWNTTTVGTIDLLLTSFRNLSFSTFTALLSDPISDADYRLDYVVLPIQNGANLEIFTPPSALVEAHYDTLWPYWNQGAALPNPDGVRSEFGLTPNFPLADSQSIYTALNGRLMTQGGNAQYVVQDPMTLRFQFIPQPNQKIWTVYPLPAPADNILPSRWDQGPITRLASSPGQSASGALYNPDKITVGGTIEIRGELMTATATASGLLFNPTVIAFGDVLTFVELAVTLTAAGIPSSEDEFATNVGQNEDAQSLVDAINAHSVLNLSYWADNLGGGNASIKARTFGGTALNQTLTVTGISFVAVSVTGDQVATPSIFPAGISRAIDTAGLNSALNSNPNLSLLYFFTSVTGQISITAKLVGVSFNALIFITGTSITSSGISGGSNPFSETAYITEETFYAEDAPVVTLDGVSTKLYHQYSGNRVLFDFFPVIQQEAYSISETFPIDYHPLDSMVVNTPCSYPKGIFVQGLFTQLLESPIRVIQDGRVIAITQNFPIQEEPQGLKDGINLIFTMSLPSCNSKNSLMVWVDGIFQPPTTYTYLTVAGQGQITLSTAPVLNQLLWVWYLPDGIICPLEHVDPLGGAIDGVNQNFSIPNLLTNAADIVVFLEGVYNLQGSDYIVDGGNFALTYQGALAPAIGQSLFAHYNEGTLDPHVWRQIFVAVTDGVTADFFIPFTLNQELPVTAGSVLLFLDGRAQREGIDFTVIPDSFGSPTNQITWNVAPPANLDLAVAYIQKGP